MDRYRHHGAWCRCTECTLPSEREPMIMDELCICGHDKEQHEMLTHPIGVGCCLATSDCCCEGYLPADEPRNGDPAQAEPPELSGRGWGLGPFDRS